MQYASKAHEDYLSIRLSLDSISHINTTLQSNEYSAKQIYGNESHGIHYLSTITKVSLSDSHSLFSLSLFVALSQFVIIPCSFLANSPFSMGEGAEQKDCPGGSRVRECRHEGCEGYC